MNADQLRSAAFSHLLKYLQISFIFFLLILFRNPVYAQNWIHNGPYGGSIVCVVVSPLDTSIVFLGTWNHGIWRSEDGGSSWVQSSEGLPQTNDPSGKSEYHTIWGIAPHLSSVDTVWCWSFSYDERVGVSISVDRGVTWTHTSNSGLPEEFRINKMIVLPDRPNILYAGVYSGGGSPSGLYRSFDYGESWEHVSGLDPTSIYVIRHEPGNSSHLYVVTSDGFFESLDDGETWQFLLDLNSEEGFSIRGCLEIDPSDHQHLFGIGPPINGFGDMPYPITSHDGGVTWSPLSVPHTYALRLHMDSAGNLLIANIYGVYKSTDSGQNWTCISEELPFFPIYDFTTYIVSSIVTHPLNPATVFIGSKVYYPAGDGALWRSTDGGFTMEPVNEGLDMLSIFRIMASPSNPDVVYAMSTCSQWKSVDEGSSWSLLDFQPSNVFVVDPQDENTVFRGYRREYGYPLERSRNGGESWEVVGENIYGEILWLKVNPVYSNIVYCVTFDDFTGSPPFYRSIDGGDTWTNLDFIPYPTVLLLAMEEEEPDVLYISAFEGLYRSEDAGESWNLFSEPGVNGPISLQTGSDGILMSLRDSLLYSNDGGITFDLTIRPPAEGISGYGYFRPGSREEIYFKSSEEIYFTKNLGETWELIDGPYSRPINSMNLVSNGTIHIGSSENGIWTGREVISDAPDPSSRRPIPVTISLHPAYPNPFNTSTAFRISLPRPQTAHLTIFNLQGHIVQRLWNGQLSAGDHFFSWNGLSSNLVPVASGTYFIQLHTVNSNYTRTITLLK